MAYTSTHPAPGLGQMLPGWFAVPQNPMGGASPRYQPSMGEIVGASFVVPQNPLVRAMAQGVMPDQGKGLMGTGFPKDDCVCGCGGGGGCGGGMGSLTDDLSGYFEQAKTYATDGGTGTLVTVAVVGLILWSTLGGSAYKDRAAALRAEYSMKARQLKSSYPSIAGRARRASKRLAAAF